MDEQLADLTNMVRGNLTPLQRATISALLVLDVHNRDIILRLIQSKLSSVNDFEWKTQMRYYWEEQDCVIRILNSSFSYGYEYTGNTSRLVLTPLTERTFRTLSTALSLNLGGAPTGPAGTGKTETIKDLAKAFARHCVVFNCSAALDYRALGKMFKGLASTGAWGCFDEFNRIEIGVLSVVSQQVLSIQQAFSDGSTHFNLEGSTIQLDKNCAIFITMNPGYAGRTELPDNLKAMFRPAAMIVADYTNISEILLFAEGFQNATSLSRKIVNCFKLASEQLSSQHHYDFGMRAIKTVLSMAGNLKRKEPTLSEDLILLKALKECNLPKFVESDIPLFNAILSDLFPGVEVPQSNYGTLHKSLLQTIEVDFGFQALPALVSKCLQLYDTIGSRQGIMIVGPPASGKTSCYRILARALTKLQETGDVTGRRVETVVVNPKAITLDQLYGRMLPTSEWSDGFLSHVMRSLVSTPNTDVKEKEGKPVDEPASLNWIIFDGPVDSLWVESMNTVLDDNRLLCLTNGERIPVQPSTRYVKIRDCICIGSSTDHKEPKIS
jgi:dynein heavy chain